VKHREGVKVACHHLVGRDRDCYPVHFSPGLVLCFGSSRPLAVALSMTGDPDDTQGTLTAN
jgi:hypothetical protein